MKVIEFIFNKTEKTHYDHPHNAVDIILQKMEEEKYNQKLNKTKNYIQKPHKIDVWKYPDSEKIINKCQRNYT